MKMSHFKDWEVKTKKIKFGKKEKEVFYRGEWSEQIFEKSIAVVGSRRMTRYGKDVIDKFVADFVANNVTTVSGFMYGVDAQVHQKTIDYGGKTVAVFGCGLDYVYPPENEKLYTQILENGGLVISEYEKTAKPHLWKFPQRNKIVVNLSSLGTLVIEGGVKSGSLVTADLTTKAKKPLYAIPGPINSSVSAGCNKLIKEGNARLITEVGDILKIKTSTFANLPAGKAGATADKPKKLGLSKIESEIYKVLEAEPSNSDEISVQTGVDIVEIGKTISLMQIKGLVTESGGKYYLS
jgi:DNA processing protein